MQKSLTFKILVMAILTIQVEDNSVMAGIEDAMDDIRHGRVTELFINCVVVNGRF